MGNLFNATRETGQTIEKQFMTVQEAANYLGLSPSTIYKKTSANELRFYKPGKKVIYFLKSDLDAFILSGLQMTRTEMAEQAIAQMTFIKNILK